MRINTNFTLTEEEKTTITNMEMLLSDMIHIVGNGNYIYSADTGECVSREDLLTARGVLESLSDPVNFIWIIPSN